jgi:pilus assembly protein Flp/PilA
MLIHEPERSWVGRLQYQEVVQVNKFFKSFVQDESGQDLIEYALLAGFISLVAVVAITNVGTGVNTVYGNIDTQVQAIPAP